jgi:hypothetical protein
MFIGGDRDYKLIEALKKEGKYVFANVYGVKWGFILPCESGAVWEQQTCGVCCNHVYIEGIMVPLGEVPFFPEKDYNRDPIWLVSNLPEINYPGALRGSPQDLELLQWDLIRKAYHIDFDFVDAPSEMARVAHNQEGFQWIIYHGHEEGWGCSFSIEAWKEEPIVLFYPNSD